MKKFTTILVCLMAMVSVNAQNYKASTVLLHKGVATVFSTSQLQNAVDAAVAGDTILLNAAQYTTCTIDKPVTIIGYGNGTQINGDITVSIPGDVTMTTPLLYGVYVTGSVTVQNYMKSLMLRKVYMGGSFSSAGIGELKIDRCRIDGNFTINANDSVCNIDNTFIGGLYGPNAAIHSAVLNHCAIYRVYGSFVGTVVNSMVRSANWNLSSSLVNSVYGTYYYGYGNDDRCYYDNVNYVADPSCIAVNESYIYWGNAFWYSESDIRNRGWIANDSTVMGIRGGEYPFVDNYAPILPTISTATVTVNKETREMSVSVSVTK